MQPECSHPQLTHHMCVMAVLQNLPGSPQFRETGSKGSTIALALTPSSQLALKLPSPSSPAVLCTVQGDYNSFPLCPSFTFFPSHVRHDEEMRNHSLCFASAVSFMSGHCTSQGTQYPAHPVCTTASQELCISKVSIFKVSLMCADLAFSRTKHDLSAQFS